MLVLGLDPSLSNFGWALHDSEAIGAARCVDRGRFQTSSKTEFVERYKEMRASITALVGRLGVRRVGIEFPIFNDLYSEGMYGLFLYTCEALKASQADVVFFANNQTKAVVRRLLDRPKGWVMGKPDMIEGAKLDTGGGGRWSSDEADAYWVAYLAARFWGLYDGVIPEGDLTPLEKKQFTTIHTFEKGSRKGQTVKTGIMYREDERFFRWSKEGC
jgi:hypothetical protein